LCERRGALEECPLNLARYAGQLPAVDRRKAAFAFTTIGHDANHEDGPAPKKRLTRFNSAIRNS